MTTYTIWDKDHNFSNNRWGWKYHDYETIRSKRKKEELAESSELSPLFAGWFPNFQFPYLAPYLKLQLQGVQSDVHENEINQKELQWEV